MLKSITILLLAASMTSVAQPVRQWVSRYNGEANLFDLPSKMILDGAGNSYIYGESTGIGTQGDFIIIKYDASGEIIWEKRYNGKGNGADRISSATSDKNNNSIVTGFTTGSDARQYITAAKYDSSGNLIWIKTFEKKKIINGFGQSICSDNDGNIYVAGNVFNDQNNYDVVVLKYSPEGFLIRDFVYEGAAIGDCMCISIKCDSASNLVLCGQTITASSGKDIFLMKLDTTFSISWTKLINGSANSEDNVSAIALSRENEILLCGSTINTGSYFDFYVAKFNAQGNAVWNINYNGIGNDIDIPYSIDTDKNFNVIVTGYSRNDTVIGSEDILTMKISPSGKILWNKIFNGQADGIDEGFSVVSDKYGNVYTGGASDRGGVQTTYYIIKYDSTGNELWNDSYSVSNTPEDFVYELMLDSMNNLYATGISLGTGTSYDIATLKYSQTVGVNESSNQLPSDLLLYQNYPNPFNPFTVIRYDLKKKSLVNLSVFDVKGSLVSEIENLWKDPGTYYKTFESSNLPSGIYFYKINVGNEMQVRKMIIVK